MSSTVDISTTEPIITMTRLLDAPRELVWQALTEPEYVAQWFGGDGFTNPVCEMDLRPGGMWRHVMRAPNGAEFNIDCIFLEVVEPERLAWKNAVDVQAMGGPPSVTQTVTLEDLGSKTRWTLVARFATLADRDISAKMGYAEMVKQGTERLAALLIAL
jgi:uncharacterized protein YndB with AHSA1/START domain